MTTVDFSIVILEGNISSGKSTLCKYISNYLREKGKKVQEFYEFDNQILLEKFYKDRRKYGFSFQLYMQSTRLFQLEMSKYLKFLGITCIIDRGPFGDFTFAFLNFLDGSISSEDFSTYVDVCRQREFFSHLTFVDSIIYLNVSPTECFRRKNIRSHKSEELVVPDYMIQIDQIYFHVMMRVSEKYPGKVRIKNWEAYGTVDGVLSSKTSQVSFSPKHGFDEIDLSRFRGKYPSNWVRSLGYPQILDFDERWYWINREGISLTLSRLEEGRNVYLKY